MRKIVNRCHCRSRLNFHFCSLFCTVYTFSCNTALLNGFGSYKSKLLYFMTTSERWCFIQSLMMDRWLTLLRDHITTLYSTNIKHNLCSNISVNPQLRSVRKWLIGFLLVCFVFCFYFTSNIHCKHYGTKMRYFSLNHQENVNFEICLYLSWTLRMQSLAAV